MHFREWVDAVFRREGEAPTTALMRLAGESRISYKALFYAYSGSRMKPETAEKLVAFTKDAVDLMSLVMAPTRSEVKAATGTEGE